MSPKLKCLSRVHPSRWSRAARTCSGLDRVEDEPGRTETLEKKDEDVEIVVVGDAKDVELKRSRGDFEGKKAAYVSFGPIFRLSSSILSPCGRFTSSEPR